MKILLKHLRILTLKINKVKYSYYFWIISQKTAQ